MTERKFHKAVFQIEVLSEEPIGDPELEEIRHRTIEGDWSGEQTKLSEEVLDGAQAAKALLAQGSSPGFFQIDDDGNDDDEPDDNTNGVLT